MEGRLISTPPSEQKDLEKKPTKPAPYKNFPQPGACWEFNKSHEKEFCHRVWLITKPDKINKKNRTKKYICKYLPESVRHTLTEVVSAEFTRFILPRHPKTRRWVRNEKETFILSEFMEGFTALPHHLYLKNPNCAHNPQYSERIAWERTIIRKLERAQADLAELLITSIFLGEYDLRADNIGFDKQGRLHRIDFGWCFAEKSSQRSGAAYRHAITTSDLRNPLKPIDYTPDAWLPAWCLDYIDPHSQKFMWASHITLLKIIFLPDQALQEFVNCYVAETEKIKDEQSDEFHNAQQMLGQYFLNHRRKMLLKAALQWPAFIDFALHNGKQKLVNITNQFGDFVVMSKFALWNHIANAEQDLRKNFDDARNEALLFMAISSRW